MVLTDEYYYIVLTQVVNHYISIYIYFLPCEVYKDGAKFDEEKHLKSTLRYKTADRKTFYVVL